MGLKLSVAPITGAWIETRWTWLALWFIAVAPITGAWIETCWLVGTLWSILVAPITGAWIETTLPVATLIQTRSSRPSRARGLKQAKARKHGDQTGSHPSRARGLKRRRRQSRRPAGRRSHHRCVR